MIVIQTELDRRTMAVLARVSRKTLRRGRSAPVRSLAWFVVALEAFLTLSYLRGGFGGWLPNTLMGLFLLGCLLLEDQINGWLALRRTPEGARIQNLAFQEDRCYVCRSQAGESWHLYSQIRLIAETRDCFVLLTGRAQGQVFRKTEFTLGSPDQLRALLQKKTGRKLQALR